MKTKEKLIVILVVILLIFGYFIYRVIDHSATYYYTLAELNNANLIGKQIRVKGLLVKESVIWKPEKAEWVFRLTDGESELEMFYDQVIPDNFDHVQELIVEGKFISLNHFQVNKLMLQCPSKYEEVH